MFGFFKKKPKLDDQTKQRLNRLIGSRTLAIALAETVEEYVDLVNSENITIPAINRKEASVVDIWECTRLEASYALFKSDGSDPFLLAEHDRQQDLITCFLVDRPHLEFPQPHGSPMEDSLQGVGQAYLYLSKIGSQVADSLTDQTSLKLNNQTILDDFTQGVTNAALLWTNYAEAIAVKSKLPDIPDTILEIAFKDITTKSKSIALSAKFGPDHNSGIKFVENLLVKNGNDPTEFKEITQKILLAKTPEQFAK